MLYPSFPICLGRIISSHMKTDWQKRQREATFPPLVQSADKFIWLSCLYKTSIINNSAIDLLSSKHFEMDNVTKISIICSHWNLPGSFFVVQQVKDLVFTAVAPVDPGPGNFHMPPVQPKKKPPKNQQDKPQKPPNLPGWHTRKSSSKYPWFSPCQNFVLAFTAELIQCQHCVSSYYNKCEIK